jgi:hypothetical protein
MKYFKEFKLQYKITVNFFFLFLTTQFRTLAANFRQPAGNPTALPACHADVGILACLLTHPTQHYHLPPPPRPHHYLTLL